MKKLITLLLTVAMILSMAASALADPNAGLNREIYVDKTWDILEAKHDKEVTITMWIPNSATSAMGVGIQDLADKFNAEQKDRYPGKNIAVIIEYQDKSSTLNEKLQAAILSGNNPVILLLVFLPYRCMKQERWICAVCLPMSSCTAVPGMMQYSVSGKYMLNPTSQAQAISLFTIRPHGVQRRCHARC